MNEISKDYLSGGSLVSLADKYKKTVHFIRFVLSNDAIKLRHRSRKYKVLTSDFFSEIDNEEKAYVLGFIYADGYHQVASHTLAIKLKLADISLLERINELLDSERPIKILQTKLNEKIFPQCSLSITDKRMSDNLLECGMMQKKSDFIKFPGNETVPNHLLRHFVRGYFDGDGCVHYHKKLKQLTTNIISNKDFCDRLNLFFVSNGFSPKKLRKSGKMYYYCQSGNKQAARFFRLLYENATIFLERKKQIFEKYLLCTS